jgi:hypothetical protein
MKKIILTYVTSLLFLVGCGDSGNSIVGTYKNGYANKIEIKEDGTYIEYKCEPSVSMDELQTADPDSEGDMDCQVKSTGKWKLNGDKIEMDIYPYSFGVKEDRIFYNDMEYGGGTIEFIKE